MSNEQFLVNLIDVDFDCFIFKRGLCEEICMKPFVLRKANQFTSLKQSGCLRPLWASAVGEGSS